MQPEAAVGKAPQPPALSNAVELGWGRIALAVSRTAFASHPEWDVVTEFALAADAEGETVGVGVAAFFGSAVSVAEVAVGTAVVASALAATLDVTAVEFAAAAAAIVAVENDELY